jgi:spore coat protein SA
VSFHFVRPRVSLIASYLNQVFYYGGYKEAVRKVAADLKDISVMHTHGLCSMTQSKNHRFKRLVTFQGFGQLDMLTRDRSELKAALLHSVLKRVYSRGDHFTTFSDDMKKNASRLYGIDPSKISIVPHGVDTGAFSTKADFEEIQRLESKYNINKRFRVVFVGHLVRGKGLGTILRAMKILKGRRNDVMLLLKVGGMAAASTRWLVAGAGLGDDVRVISDFLVEKELRALYQLSDAFVNYHILTGYSTTVLEAMASGIPPIVYRYSPNRGLLDESAGVILNSLDPEELANAIDLLADDGGLAKRLGRNANKLAVENYDWDTAVVPRYASVYNRLING